jgi:hypothetical protein
VRQEQDVQTTKIRKLRQHIGEITDTVREEIDLVPGIIYLERHSKCSDLVEVAMHMADEGDVEPSQQMLEGPTLISW